MVVWCTQNAPKWQQFHVAPAIPALKVHHFDGFKKKREKKRYKKPFTQAESHVSAVSLLKSGAQHYIKATNNKITGKTKNVDR